MKSEVSAESRALITNCNWYNGKISKNVILPYKDYMNDLASKIQDKIASSNANNIMIISVYQ